MESFEQYHSVIRERINNPNARYYAVPWWDAEVRLFVADMTESINSIQQSCTDEELYWLGEVFDDIVQKTRSAAFIDCLRERVKRVTNQEWKGSIIEDIRIAAEYIDDTSQ